MNGAGLTGPPRADHFLLATPALDSISSRLRNIPRPECPPAPLPSNFTFLEEHDPQLLRLGVLAERYFPGDPNTSLIKLRQFSELLAQPVAARAGLFVSPEEAQYELLGRLQDEGILTRDTAQLFHAVRRTGNAATHTLAGDHRSALATLKLAWQLGIWFHRTFKRPEFKAGPFVPPRPPEDESAGLHAELATLAASLAEWRAAHEEAARQLEWTAAQLREAQTDQEFWEQMAAEADAGRSALAARLAARQAETANQPATAAKAAVTRIAAASRTASEQIELDEAGTRKLIDAQLQQAGWTADSVTLRYADGTRPEKGRNMAIAEWPTASGPADYVLFCGLVPVAAIEAKRKNTNVSASLQQAKRYSRGFLPSEECLLPAQNWGKDGEFRLPFVFSANGRPFLRQLSTHSGTWFGDLRCPDNLGRVLDGWYSPDGLTSLLKLDAASAHDQLTREVFDYGFVIREYQQRAIVRTEEEIARGVRELLLAMATGTGKTKTCIALIYRLLKTRRFRRILFLVDRSALGEQAANAFKDTRMENLQTFADTFGIKELDAATPDSDTAVHIATIQGMVHRVLSPAEGTAPPSVDQYDCIIVDECHRGYLLDRELSETEQTFRSYDDYISKYRRVLDYFDAVKIGLTATPALHTTEIFGAPVFTYSYREAVLDGYLIDHEPPVNIITELSASGIVWQQGAEIPVYNPAAAQLELFRTPDEVRIEVEEFNKKVITRPFNEVVCRVLASEIDPASRRKTLIFCANDAHADLVVEVLKSAFAGQYGSVDDDAVIKITGKADKPLQLIRRYKNEQYPSVAVTVDLLSTGIDVPAICNLVFLRRVNSRILFDQMMGRATRPCEGLGKDTFRIFDAVRIYEALEGITAMQPVAVNPGIAYTQLIQEMTGVGEEALGLVRDQFVARLQRKKRHLTEQAARDFEICAGMNPEEFIRHLRQLPLPEIAGWFVRHPGLGEILDRKSDAVSPPVFISEHPDRRREVSRGFGAGVKPEDYLQAFRDFINTRGNEIPALVTLVTRPRSLTRRQLREVLYSLDLAGFSEANLKVAYVRRQLELTTDDN